MSTNLRPPQRLVKRISATALALAILACGDGPLTTPEIDALSQGAANPNLPGAQGVVATADFHHASVETCYETVAAVEVSQAPGKDRETTLDFRYYVLGICGDQEGLFHVDLGNTGKVHIDPTDFVVLPGRRGATLDTEIEVFDQEAAVFDTIRLQVTWAYTQNRREMPTLRATLGYSGAFTATPGVNPISTDDAELSPFAP
jgi:hypothetical protein